MRIYGYILLEGQEDSEYNKKYKFRPHLFGQKFIFIVEFP